MQFLANKNKDMEKQLQIQARRGSLRKNRPDSLSNKKKKMLDSQNSFPESPIFY